MTYRSKIFCSTHFLSCSFCCNSNISAAWMVPRILQPQCNTSSTAWKSSMEPSSSTAITSGDMERRSILIPTAFLHLSITSVRMPRLFCGIPRQQAAISERSSTTPTLKCILLVSSPEIRRIQSRSRVVFPIPTEDTKSVFLTLCSVRIKGRISFAHPIFWCAILMFNDPT